MILKINDDLEEIRNWAITYNIGTYRRSFEYITKKTFTSKCSKTFLNSSKAEYVKTMKGANDQIIGEFVYLEIEKGLLNYVDPNV